MKKLQRRKKSSAPIEDDLPDLPETTADDQQSEPNPSDADIDDQELQDTADQLNPDVSQRAWEYLEMKKIASTTVTATLYRITNQGKRVQAGKWKDQIPDQHSIGLVHGCGSYELIITWPPKGIKKFMFELDKYYDTLKQEAQMMGTVPALGRIPPAPQLPAPTPIGNQGAGGGDNTINLIQTIFGMIQPLIQQRPDNTMAQMMQMYQMMGFVMKKSLMDQTDFMADMQERLLENMPQAQQPTVGEDGMTPNVELEKPKTFMETALPYIVPFLERLTTGTNVEREATANVINAIPAVQKMITDPKHKSDCKNLIAYLDKNLPKGKTDEILLALKVDRGMYV